MLTVSPLWTKSVGKLQGKIVTGDGVGKNLLEGRKLVSASFGTFFGSLGWDKNASGTIPQTSRTFQGWCTHSRITGSKVTRNLEMERNKSIGRVRFFCLSPGLYVSNKNRSSAVSPRVGEMEPCSTLDRTGPQKNLPPITLDDEKEEIGLTRRAANFAGFILSYMKYHSSFEQSQLRVVPEHVTDNETFDDVKGIDDTKLELKEVVEFLRNPAIAYDEGKKEEKIPKGVLLVGVPGTGRSLLARAVAGEAQVPLFRLDGSELGGMPENLAGTRVFKVFVAAVQNSPCVIFIDQLESFRWKQMLWSLIDGIPDWKGVVVIASTTPTGRNSLDAAFLRPNRFSLEVHVSGPDLRGRREIIKRCLGRMKCSSNIDPDEIARSTLGFTGSEIENMINEAALRAAFEKDESLAKEHLEFVRNNSFEDTDHGGYKKNVRKLGTLSDQVKLRLAYHEAGHALVAIFTKDAPQIRKVSIIPKRGEYLGQVSYLPRKADSTPSQVVAYMDTCFGGAAAEEFISGMDQITEGISKDLKQATNSAARLVKGFGASGEPADAAATDVTTSTPEERDNEIKSRLQESYSRAKAILAKHPKELEAVVEALLKHETLNGEQVESIIAQCSSPGLGLTELDVNGMGQVRSMSPCNQFFQNCSRPRLVSSGEHAKTFAGEEAKEANQPQKDGRKGKSGPIDSLASFISSNWRFMSSFQVLPEHVKETFEDVKGVDEPKGELKNLVALLQNPDRFVKFGAKLPKGVLLVGASGTGKRLLARAVAGEAQVPYFYLNGEELQSVLESVAVVRIKSVFEAAKANSPCVVFMSQIDTIGRQSKRELVTGIEGISENEGLIVIASTTPSCRHNLDKDLLCPSRFSREVNVFAPDLRGRKDIAEKFLARIRCGSDVDADEIAQNTLGFTGGDLEIMINEAAKAAAHEGAESSWKQHLAVGRNKVFQEYNNSKTKFGVWSHEDKLQTACHVAGHALVAMSTEHAPILHKVSIIPRYGESFGHTCFLNNRGPMTRAQCLASMDTELGGLAAEALLFGQDERTDQVSQDSQDATNLAFTMVAVIGASEKLGLRSFCTDLRSPTARLDPDIDPSTKKMIDDEIRRLFWESFNRAKNVIKERLEYEYQALVEALLKFETLDMQQVKSIIAQNTKPAR